MSNASKSMLSDTILGLFTHQTNNNNNNKLQLHRLEVYNKGNEQHNGNTRHQLNNNINNNHKINTFNNKLHTYTEVFRHRLERIKL